VAGTSFFASQVFCVAAFKQQRTDFIGFAEFARSARVVCAPRQSSVGAGGNTVKIFNAAF
jgi:hypothetical protein